MSYEIVPGRPSDQPRVDFTKPGPSDRSGASSGPFRDRSGPTAGPEVGSFRRTTAGEDEILRRYLLARAIGSSVVRSVHWLGVVILVLAALIWLTGVHWLAVLIGIVGVLVLLVRVMLSGLTRRISGADRMGPAAAQVDQLVGRTRKGLRAELRRIELPSGPWGPLLIATRLIRSSSRGPTVRKLQQFELTQVVPPSTLDELHLALFEGNRPLH